MPSTCTDCGRDPAKVINEHSECGHVECPCRRPHTAWTPPRDLAAPDAIEVDPPIAALFDDPRKLTA